MPRHLEIRVREVPVRLQPDPTTFFGRIWQAIRSYTIAPLSIQSPEIQRLLGGTPTSSGIPMTEQTALMISAVWDAVQTIAGDIASLPLFLYRRLPNGGKELMPDHPVYRLIHDEPNPEMTSMVFRETLQGHVLLWGNAYAEIERSVLGRPLALWPLTPDRVKPERDRATDRLIYRVWNRNGSEDIFQPEDILHVPGLGYDGTCGYSVIAKARESLALAVAAERFGAQFFGQGARSGGVFTHPNKLSQTAKDNIKSSLKNMEPHEYAVLEEGMTLERWTIPPDDAQFLQTRTLQVTEVARWFGIPPHKLADLSRATFSNIEQQEIDYVSKTLRRWLVRWEQEYTRKLVRPLERGIQLVEHNIDGLLRGDIESRYRAYATGRQWGWLSVNEIREKENMNPIDEGDVYLIPGNMLPADKADEIVPPGSQPPAAAPVPEPASPEDDRDYKALTAAVEQLRPEIGRVEEAMRQAIATGQIEAAKAMAAGLAALRAELAETQERALAAEQEREARRDAEKAADHEAIAELQADMNARAQAPPEPLVIGPVEVAGMAELVAQLRAEQEAAEARQAAIVDAVTARLAETEAAVKESVASLREGAAKTAQRVQDRLATVAGAAAERQRYQQDRAGIHAAHRRLIQDAMRRVLHREGLAARKAAGSPDKLRAWLDTFYARRQPMTDAVGDVMQLHVVLTRSTEPAAARADALIAAHCQRSRGELEALLETAPADLTASVEALTARWEQDRPGQVAEELMGEVTANVSE